MDKLIDKNLNLIYQSQNPLFLVSHLENEKGERCGLKVEGQRIAQILASQGLVTSQGDFCQLTLEGHRIVENKGWLQHSNAQRRENTQEKMTKFLTLIKLYWWVLCLILGLVWAGIKLFIG